MFNEYQIVYMEEISKRDLTNQCYCGWYWLGECPHCPTNLTCQDKMDKKCSSCGNSPRPDKDGLFSWPMVHRIGCKLD